jgi:uncharacterized RDD family membrane protein YckC
MGAPPPPAGGSYEEPQVPWSPPPFGTTAPSIAGRWRRLFAGIVDGVIVGIVSAPFTLETWQVVWNPPAGTVARISVGPALLAALIGFLYYWLLQSFWNGQTLGKKLFGMRVVHETGARAGPGQVAVRQIVEIILGGLCCLGLIDLAWILIDRRNQALHDKAARTLVVDA